MSEVNPRDRHRIRARLCLPRPGSGGRYHPEEITASDRAWRAWVLIGGCLGDVRQALPVGILAACRIAYERDRGYVVIVDGDVRWVLDDTEACRLAMTARHAARILSLAECRSVDAAAWQARSPQV